MNLFFDPPLGANYLGNDRCRFTVWAPFAHTAGVCFPDRQSETIPLEKMGGGYFSKIVDSVSPGTRYVYRLYRRHEPTEHHKQFEDWPDPASRCQPDGVHGPSQVVSSAFNWKETKWRGIPLSTYIISEIHVGTYSKEGTFDAVISDLDRLKETGFTALELMPVAQFPGERNWGYDGVFPFAVQNTYGGISGLKRLVDACHMKGLAVVLDVVYNHLGPEGNYFGKFGDYFTDFYKTPWGEAINFDGPHSEPVRRFFIENALYWISEFKIDALRLDAIHAIYDFSAFPFLEELALAIHRAGERLNRRIYCISESALNDTRVVRSRKLGGFNHDAQWNDDFHHCLHILLTGEQSGYYMDFKSLKDFAKAWEEGYVYSGQYSKFRNRRHGNSSRNIPARRFVVFGQNHDQIGNRMLGERFSSLVSFEKLKLTAGLVLLSPFIPLLFMGEEYGETAPFQYFVSHTDPDLVKAVQKGRAAEFEAFSWTGTPPDPQDETTFFRSKLNHNLIETGHHRLLLDFHKQLIQFRKEIDSLSLLSQKNMTVKVDDLKQSLFVRRWSTDNEIFCIFRFGNDIETVQVPIPSGRWNKIIDSWDLHWQGPGSTLPSLADSGENTVFQVPPDGLVMYFRKKSSFNMRKEHRIG